MVYNPRGLFLAHPYVHDGSTTSLFHVIFTPGPRLRELLSLSLWNIARFHGRRKRDMVNNMLGLQPSVPKWHTSLLLTFHWPEQVLRLHDDRVGAHNSAPGRLYRGRVIHSSTVDYFPIQTYSSVRGTDSHWQLFISWPWAFSEPQFYPLWNGDSNTCPVNLTEKG